MVVGAIAGIVTVFVMIVLMLLVFVAVSSALVADFVFVFGHLVFGGNCLERMV